MKPADLKILVQEGEGTTLEFKENLPASVARDLVAMANTIGGKILLGVRDDGTVVGVKDSNNLRARTQDIAATATRRSRSSSSRWGMCSWCMFGIARPSRCSAARTTSGARAR